MSLTTACFIVKLTHKVTDSMKYENYDNERLTTYCCYYYHPLLSDLTHSLPCIYLFIYLIQFILLYRIGRVGVRVGSSEKRNNVGGFS